MRWSEGVIARQWAHLPIIIVNGPLEITTGDHHLDTTILIDGSRIDTATCEERRNISTLKGIFQQAVTLQYNINIKHRVTTYEKELLGGQGLILETGFEQGKQAIEKCRP